MSVAWSPSVGSDLFSSYLNHSPWYWGSHFVITGWLKGRLNELHSQSLYNVVQDLKEHSRCPEENTWSVGAEFSHSDYPGLNWGWVRVFGDVKTRRGRTSSNQDVKEGSRSSLLTHSLTATGLRETQKTQWGIKKNKTIAIVLYAELTTVSSFCIWMSRFLALKYIHTYLYMCEHIETPRVLDPTSIALSLAFSTARCILGISLRCIALFIRLD